MTHSFRSKFFWRLCFLCATFVPFVSTSVGQDAAPVVSRNKELSKIDSRATKVDDVFIRNAVGIASEYEKAGDVARAVDYLQAMSLLKPGMPAIESKLKQLNDKVLEANEFNFTLEPSASWGNPVGYVREGKPFRVNAQGEYTLLLNAEVGPSGFPDDDAKTGLIKDAPLGKLVGVIVEVPKPESKRRAKNKKDEPEPFEIGAERVIRPRYTGYLYLKVNLPAESTPSGSLQVRLSGYVLAPNGQNIGR